MTAGSVQPLLLWPSHVQKCFCNIGATLNVSTHKCLEQLDMRVCPKVADARVCLLALERSRRNACTGMLAQE
jgi:hypothetical protein